MRRDTVYSAATQNLDEVDRAVGRSDISERTRSRLAHPERNNVAFAFAFPRCLLAGSMFVHLFSEISGSAERLLPNEHDDRFLFANSRKLRSASAAVPSLPPADTIR